MRRTLLSLLAIISLAANPALSNAEELSFEEFAIEASQDTATGDIEINETNFPDANFRNWILRQDYGKDGLLTEEEIRNITYISVGVQQISTLKGIEYFTSLERLSCYSNRLTSLDVSKNTTLTRLDCHSNQLFSIDVSKNTALTWLDCFTNQLTSLDVSKNTALEHLWCWSNQLTYLDVSKNTALNYLNCSSNQLTTLDVSMNTALTTLSCHSNRLASLDVSKNTALEFLDCYSNQLTSLDVSQNTALYWLYCYSNQIKRKAMDILISSLPYNSTNNLYRLYLISPSDDDEGNVCTKSQVAAVKAKRWTPLYYIDGYWQEYEGSEDSEITIEDFDIKAGEEKELLINLTNPNNEVTRVQLDLHLPEGLTIKKSGDDFDFDMAGRTTWRKHRLDVNEVDGAYRFLLYSSSNTLIEGTSGAIVKMTIVADETFKVGLLVIDNCLLVSPDDSETEIEAYEYIIGEATPDDGSTILNIEPFDIKVGETKEMLIDLTNPDDEVTTVQFDLHLPEGLTIKKSGDELDFDMAGRTTWRKHTLDVNEVGGAYHFHLYSSSNTLIEGTSGPIIKLTVTASQEMNGRKILIDKALLVSTDGKETRPASYLYVIRTFSKGDVNGDGNIGIGDIITVTNVMASDETNADVVRRADVNDDGEVEIGDIISISNIMAGE